VVKVWYAKIVWQNSLAGRTCGVFKNGLHHSSGPISFFLQFADVETYFGKSWWKLAATKIQVKNAGEIFCVPLNSRFVSLRRWSQLISTSGAPFVPMDVTTHDTGSISYILIIELLHREISSKELASNPVVILLFSTLYCLTIVLGEIAPWIAALGMQAARGPGKIVSWFFMNFGLVVWHTM